MKRTDRLKLLASRKAINQKVEEDGLESVLKSLKGLDGRNGKDGKDGRAGFDGKDGYTPVKGKDYFDGKDGLNGKDGQPGLPGKQGDPGIPGLVWRGDWSYGTQYKVNDGVAHLGSSFICLAEHKANRETEPIDGIYSKNYWSPLALKGEKGEPGGSGGAPAPAAAAVVDTSPRVTTIVSSATPTFNTDNCDAVSITALATAITSMTTNLTGTPVDFEKLTIRIKDDGTARAIAWGAKYEARGVPLPTTTVISKVLTVGFIYDIVTLKWGCVASAQET